jgi:drug/metabolite transporter (DMT)-like permease
VNPSREDERAAHLSLALAGIIWGTSFILGKIALRELGVDQMMLYRFLFASLAFLPLIIRERPRFSHRDLALVFVAALIGVPLQFLMQFRGLSLTTASHAALMIGTAPVLVAIGGFFVFRERLSPLAWLSLVASTAGVALIVHGGGGGGGGGGGRGADRPTLHGDLLVLFSMFSATVWVLASKYLMQRHSPTAVSGTITLIGTAMLAIWVIARDGAPTTDLHNSTWIAVLALGVVATTCTTLLWNWGLQHTDAGRAGAFINLEPVVGAALGVTLLHESLGPWAVVGGALIIAGAMVVSLTAREKGKGKREKGERKENGEARPPSSRA